MGQVDAQGNQTEDDITVKNLFKRFEEQDLSKKNLVVEREKFFWKNQHDEETFDQFMTATQQRYAPIEQEMLAVVSGCQRFHLYIIWKESDNTE